jgi:geranylgeranyl diphosphate synthase type I
VYKEHVKPLEPGCERPGSGCGGLHELTKMKYFEQNKKEVISFLESFLQAKKNEFAGVNRWGTNTIDKILPFIKTGKMLRSGLVSLGYRMNGKKRASAAIPAAAAAECIQAALLIHDDIIDRDRLRRGLPSVHYQYVVEGERKKADDPGHFGEGMGICVGDIGFFLAFELLSDMKAGKERKQKVLHLWAKELSYVGLAQMQDLYFGSTSSNISEDEILSLYLYKTARYSFTVPLVSGCILGGGDETLQNKLDDCGESLGLLFQLRDDELGLFGTEAEMGKPVGSDIRENKKTLYHYYLFQRASSRDRKRLARIFGQEQLAAEEIEEVKDMLEVYRISSTVRDKMLNLSKRARNQIKNLEVGFSEKQVLFELLDYILERNK